MLAREVALVVVALSCLAGGLVSNGGVSGQSRCACARCFVATVRAFCDVWWL